MVEQKQLVLGYRCLIVGQRQSSPQAFPQAGSEDAGMVLAKLHCISCLLGPIGVNIQDFPNATEIEYSLKVKPLLVLGQSSQFCKHSTLGEEA